MHSVDDISDFFCTDCNSAFESASSLLKHFAVHASQTSKANELVNSGNKSKKAEVPDLYPIANIKVWKKVSTVSISKEENVDSAYEDLNPMKFCLVTMDDRLSAPKLVQHGIGEKAERTNSEELSNPKKYQCMYCSKNFGWCTDLKRHVLVHTGERPFKCSNCSFRFTRNFLLQKHVRKYHHSDVDIASPGKVKIPALKPLFLKHKSRKQDKCNIKRKHCKTKNMYQRKNDHFKSKNNLICTA